MSTVFALLTAALLHADAEISSSPNEVRVIETSAVVYTEPDPRAPVLRRLYLGEVVTATTEVVAPDGTRWLQVALGAEAKGYVRKEKVGTPGTVPVEQLKPVYFVRDERPLVIGPRFGGETLGAGINVR